MNSPVKTSPAHGNGWLKRKPSKIKIKSPIQNIKNVKRKPSIKTKFPRTNTVPTALEKWLIISPKASEPNTHTDTEQTSSNEFINVEDETYFPGWKSFNQGDEHEEMSDFEDAENKLFIRPTNNSKSIIPSKCSSAVPKELNVPIIAPDTEKTCNESIDTDKTYFSAWKSYIQPQRDQEMSDSEDAENIPFITPTNPKSITSYLVRDKYISAVPNPTELSVSIITPDTEKVCNESFDIDQTYFPGWKSYIERDEEMPDSDDAENISFITPTTNPKSIITNNLDRNKDKYNSVVSKELKGTEQAYNESIDVDETYFTDWKSFMQTQRKEETLDSDDSENIPCTPPPPKPKSITTRNNLLENKCSLAAPRNSNVLTKTSDPKQDCNESTDFDEDETYFPGWKSFNQKKEETPYAEDAENIPSTPPSAKSKSIIRSNLVGRVKAENPESFPSSSLNMHSPRKPLTESPVKNNPDWRFSSPMKNTFMSPGKPDSTLNAIFNFNKLPSPISTKYKSRPEKVRKKEDRKKLPGWDCPECQAYYGNFESQYLTQELISLRNKCSRHRAKEQKVEYLNDTPQYYWVTDMPESEDLLNEGLIRVGTRSPVGKLQ